MSRNHFVVVTALILAACGGGKKDSGPTTPPPPPPPPPPAVTVTSITVSAAQGPLSALGATLTLSAEVRLSNGSIGTEVPAWSSSAPNVATVAGGIVTAVGNGQATITASIGSVSGQATVTVAQVVTSVRLLPGDSVIKSVAALRGTALDARSNPVVGAPAVWESLSPQIVAVSPTGNLTPLATGVARVRFTSGAFSSTAIVRTVWNVTNLNSLFPLFEYSASNGQRRVISDISQAHADARAVVMGQVWNYLSTILPSNGGNTTDMYFTGWTQIWTEFNPFCGGQLLPNQVNYQWCTTPYKQHFMNLTGTSPDDFLNIARFLARQFMLASHAGSNTNPWFVAGYSQWLMGGAVTANGVSGKVYPVSTADFRTGDTQNRLAPLDTLIRLNYDKFLEDLPLRTPVAVRQAQSVMLISYLATLPGNTLCRIFASLRGAPGSLTNDQTIAVVTQYTGKTIAEIETGYLAHARALVNGAVPTETVVPVSCS